MANTGPTVVRAGKPLTGNTAAPGATSAKPVPAAGTTNASEAAASSATPTNASAQPKASTASPAVSKWSEFRKAALVLLSRAGKKAAPYLKKAAILAGLGTIWLVKKSPAAAKHAAVGTAKASKLAAKFPSSPLLPLTVGIGAATACFVTRSYTQDPASTNRFHMGIVGGAEMLIAAGVGIAVGNWIQNIHRRPARATLTQAVVFSALTLAIPTLLGKSPDPFVAIPYKVLHAFGVHTPNAEAVNNFFDDSTSTKFSSTIVRDGDRISVQMAGIGLRYGVDGTGNPDKMNREAIPAGSAFCAIGTSGEFYKVMTADSQIAFIRKSMAIAGGNVCNTLKSNATPAAPPPQSAPPASQSRPTIPPSTNSPVRQANVFRI